LPLPPSSTLFPYTTLFRSTRASSPCTLRERWTKGWPGGWRRTGHSMWSATRERDHASLEYVLAFAPHSLVAGAARLRAECLRRGSGWTPGPRREKQRDPDRGQRRRYRRGHAQLHGGADERDGWQHH